MDGAMTVSKKAVSGAGLPPKKPSSVDASTLPTTALLQQVICSCTLCPRLVEWREKVARDKIARFQNQKYWGRPVPSLGDAAARLLVVGLAPAAHGGNRTGRIFTGDRSGDWLYRALHRFGFANQPYSIDRDDGLRLFDCYITAVVHCAPPLNRPDPQEIANCNRYLTCEWQLLASVRVIVALGRIAFDQVWLLAGGKARSKRPQFRHGLELPVPPDRTLIASFHPSQQNTFTGKLTKLMFDRIFERARQIISADRPDQS
jgi:uracil-DNA glycosylase family 4